MYERVEHCYMPVYSESSRVLLLGTVPSPASRKNGFYYSHPQNRFWRVLSAVCRDKLPETPEEKTSFLLRHNIALWDVLSSCDIEGASDVSIKNEIPNDINLLLSHSGIEKLLTTGSKAYSLYNKYMYPQCKMKAEALPSTSPANARMKLPELISIYGAALEGYII